MRQTALHTLIAVLGDFLMVVVLGLSEPTTDFDQTGKATVTFPDGRQASYWNIKRFTVEDLTADRNVDVPRMDQWNIRKDR